MVRATNYTVRVGGCLSQCSCTVAKSGPIGTVLGMPELVEVDIGARGLDNTIKGKRIEKVRCGTNPRFKDAKLAKNYDILKVTRRGKYIMLELTGDKTMIVHLGMTGQLLLNSPVDSHIRATFRMGADILKLRDPRGFGLVKVVGNDQDHGLKTLNSLGPEYCDKNFTQEHTQSVVGASTCGIKTLLLKQTILAGVGNYICDEALHRALVHPLKRKLTTAECGKLHKSLLDIVAESMALGGVSMRDYVHVDGTKGTYQNFLKVYGRGGLLCLTCATRLTKAIVSGRGTVYCETCQKI